MHEVQKRFVVLSISIGYTFSELRCYGYEYYCIVGFSLCEEYARL